MKSLSHYKVDGLDFFVVENPHTCENFDHLIGELVEIDGVNYTVEGVERFAHCPPFKVGEKIGLQVMIADPHLKWKWMMDYCKQKRWAPADFWDLAEKAWLTHR